MNIAGLNCQPNAYLGLLFLGFLEKKTQGKEGQGIAIVSSRMTGRKFARNSPRASSF